MRIFRLLKFGGGETGGPCTCRAKKYVGTFKSRVRIYMLILQSLKYQSIVFTDRIKQGSLFDVSLLYS